MLNNRFLADAHAIPVMLAKLGDECEAELFIDRCERLRILYDTFAPRKET